MHVRITLLGRFAVEVDGSEVPADAWRRRGAATLVKVLALAPGRRLHREQVVDALWPEEDPRTAGPRLHKAAHYARRALGAPDGLVLDGELVRLLPNHDVVVDAVELTERATAALARGDPGLAAEVAAALRASGGVLLPDDVYEEWAAEPRDRVTALHHDLLRTAGAWAALADLDPTDEEAHRHLARDALDGGDAAAALRWLERLERATRRELGVGPGPAVERLRRRVLAVLDDARGPSEAPVPDVVGRDHELRRLERLLTDVRLGHGQALFVAGPAGVGTSTVLLCLERLADARGMRVGTAVATRQSGAWPYAPVLEALADLCRRHPEALTDVDAAVRAEVERAVSGLDQDWRGGSSHQRLHVATTHLLRRAAADGGAVLVIDDVAEADGSTLHLVHHLVRATVGSAVLVAVGHRPEPPEGLRRLRTALLARDQATTLDLRPLAPSAAEALVRRWVDDDDVVAALCEAAGGLPLDLVESARATARGEADPRRALLDRFADDDVVTFLRTVAVLGLDLESDLAAAVAGVEEAAAWSLLDRAVRRGLLVRTPTGTRFRHALLRDALLDHAPAALREAHRTAACVLAGRGGPAARVAHHLLAAGDRDAAAPWVLRAAGTDAALGAYQAALDWLDQVADVVAGSDRAHLLALRARLLHESGSAEAATAYRAALAAADDPVEARRLRTQLGNTAALRGDIETARVALAGLGPDGRDAREDVELLVALAHMHLFGGDIDAAQDAVARARAMVALTPGSPAAEFALVTVEGLIAHHRGEWVDRLHVELHRGVVRPGVALGVFDSHLCVAEYLLYGPTPNEEVVTLATDLAEHARRSGSRRAEAFAVALRGEAALLDGDLERAAEDLTAAVGLHRGIDAAAGEAHTLERLAEVWLARGDAATAQRLLDRALPLARWSTQPACLLPRIYGTRVAAATDWWSARARVEEAVSAMGQDDDCPFCSIMFHLPAARALADGGDLAGAREHLEAAERSGTRWRSRGWDAALLEARAHLVAAEGDEAAAEVMRRQAASLYGGEPFDAARCAV